MVLDIDGLKVLCHLDWILSWWGIGAMMLGFVVLILAISHDMKQKKRNRTGKSYRDFMGGD